VVHLSDLERVVAGPAVDGREDVVVVERERVVARAAVDRQAAVHVAVVIDALDDVLEPRALRRVAERDGGRGRDGAVGGGGGVVPGPTVKLSVRVFDGPPMPFWSVCTPLES